MKLLLIYCNRFAYKPALKTLEDAEEVIDSAAFEKVQTAFIQVEAEDEDRGTSVAKKLLKNLKWICPKNGTKEILLHSFAHLSESKADPAFTKSLFDNVEERLTASGYTVHQTPFGYFLDLDLQAPGFSLARVFKSL